MTHGTLSGTVFEDACAALEEALRGPVRRGVVADVGRAQPFGEALARLRDRMRSDGWIRELDRRTRGEGFHVLHDWDGKADAVNPDIIPIDVLNYVAANRGETPTVAGAIAILLDYYYFHLLSLLSVRLWDGGGDADARLDRLQALLDLLQGSDGSGQRFVGDAETLILIATSHYERHEEGYDLLLDRTRSLDRAHRVRIALGHASSMGSHLRFGFEATYARDTLLMRHDNVADYPWLCFALVTLMREYSGLRGDAPGGSVPLDAIAEALLNGLSADARAFVGEPAEALAHCEDERSEFRDLFLRCRDELLSAFETYRPRADAYSPLSFFFNFAHNTVKGTVVDALLRDRTWAPAFDDLLTARPSAAADATKIELATTLMAYARANPDRIRGELTPVIVYDPRAGHAAFTATMRKLRQ